MNQLLKEHEEVLKKMSSEGFDETLWEKGINQTNAKESMIHNNYDVMKRRPQKLILAVEPSRSYIHENMPSSNKLNFGSQSNLRKIDPWGNNYGYSVCSDNENHELLIPELEGSFIDSEIDESVKDPYSARYDPKIEIPLAPGPDSTKYLKFLARRKNVKGGHRKIIRGKRKIEASTTQVKMDRKKMMAEDKNFLCADVIVNSQSLSSYKNCSKSPN